ncbi:hypothetical protein JTB14_005357 [Gonioctena quinquepunctata]|nr:hypothetical protein JTB14_005357 [Gonioctena quinquepunctata]
MSHIQVALIFTLLPHLALFELPRNTYQPVKVNKCCEENEIYVGKYCTKVNKSEEWRPLFTTDKGLTNLQRNYTLVTGLPDCGHMQLWAVLHYQNSSDRLGLLPDGVLRHYFDHKHKIDEENAVGPFHDYEFGKYCLDRKIDDSRSDFAWVCPPEFHENWLTSTEFLLHNVVSPTTHGMTMVCLLAIAIIYFVLPTLRDLTGNIITTICMCLILGQTANLIRLLTVFKNHISLLIAEAICYISILAAFFWLNCLGYYIWKTFRSRNVFLRITDGKKYCYYCSYAWSCTIILGVFAIAAHFTMDYPDVQYSHNLTFDQEREQIGSLGLIIFFVPIAFTILVDVFFLSTTMKTINRMHTYGRIHHKVRHSFRMFLLLLLVMTFWWLFFLSSFSKYEGLVNCHIIVNALLGPLILYVCIFNQKHVAYLIQKMCCYNNFPCCKPDPETEWGDEMTAMNTINNC